MAAVEYEEFARSKSDKTPRIQLHRIRSVFRDDMREESGAFVW